MCEYFSLIVFAKNFRQMRMQIEVLDFIFIKQSLRYTQNISFTCLCSLNGNRIKGLLILERSEYSCDFVNKTLPICCFVRSSCFSCGVDTPRVNITFRAVF